MGSRSGHDNMIIKSKCPSGLGHRSTFQSEDSRFDANITNVIAAFIMFIFGSGPIRGFAVVLTIGIVTSVFTAVTFSRLMVAQWLKKRPRELVI